MGVYVYTPLRERPCGAGVPLVPLAWLAPRKLKCTTPPDERERREKRERREGKERRGEEGGKNGG